MEEDFDIFSLFQQASEICEDLYWKKILEDSGNGKLPKGFSIHDHFIYHNRSGMQAELPNDPESVLEISVSFFREYGSMWSKDDFQQMQSFTSDKKDLTAKDIFSYPRLLNICIREYLETLHDPESEEIEEKMVHILSCIHLKKVTPNSVTVEDGKITNIEILDSSPTLVLKDGFPCEKETKNEDYEKNWSSFLKEVSKKVTTTNKSSIYSPSSSPANRQMMSPKDDEIDHE